MKHPLEGPCQTYGTAAFQVGVASSPEDQNTRVSRTRMGLKRRISNPVFYTSEQITSWMKDEVKLMRKRTLRIATCNMQEVRAKLQ